MKSDRSVELDILVIDVSARFDGAADLELLAGGKHLYLNQFGGRTVPLPSAQLERDFEVLGASDGAGGRSFRAYFGRLDSIAR